MGKRAETEPDFLRASIILNKRIKTPNDLIVYWSMSGPCMEPHPKIEDITD